MNTTIKYSALLASILLVMPFAAYADQGPYASQRLQIQMGIMTCRNTLVTDYLGDVVTAINNATITTNISNTDIPKIGTDFTALQTDTTANNTAQFNTDTKTYNSDTKAANVDINADVKIAHDKTIRTTLKSDMAQLKSSYDNCLYGVKQQQAQLKSEMYNNRLAHAQSMENRMKSHGMNTTGLNQTLDLASSQIQAFEAAVQNAQNSTQIQAALNSFCLYNGCKNPNNFHFAANVAIQSDQAKLNLLATKNTTASYQELVSQGQTDLTNAQTALTQVGTSKYQGTQSSDVWNDIKAASDVIQQLQKITSHRH